MLYLNLTSGNLSELLTDNLTLTSVVFEYQFFGKWLDKNNHLTLTSVVFEFSIGNLFLVFLVNLTLTSVVFEYIPQTRYFKYTFAI